MAMKELIAELEALTAPCRTIDAKIAKAICLQMPADPVQWPPRFSESIDAAMTLVPETHDWMVQSPSKYSQVWTYPTTKHHEGNGVTIAIALCIAALKARLNSKDET